MTQLCQRYCPKTWAEIVGQDAAVSTIRAAVKQQWGGRAWWIVGASGTGCTTIATLLARENAEEKRILFTGNNHVDFSMVHRMAHEDPGKEGRAVARAYIIDFPEGMPEDAMDLVLSVLPCLPKNVCVIFTQHPHAERDFLAKCPLAKQIISLCQRVQLATEGLEEPFAAHCKEIAEKEGLGGKDISAYRTLARECGCNMFGMLSKIECGEMMNQR